MGMYRNLVRFMQGSAVLAGAWYGSRQYSRHIASRQEKINEHAEELKKLRDENVELKYGIDDAEKAELQQAIDAVREASANAKKSLQSDDGNSVSSLLNEIKENPDGFDFETLPDRIESLLEGSTVENLIEEVA